MCLFASFLMIYQSYCPASTYPLPLLHPYYTPYASSVLFINQIIYFLFIITYRDFIYPLFIHEADYQEEISSMPGCFRHSLTTMMTEVEDAMRYFNILHQVQ